MAGLNDVASILENGLWSESDVAKFDNQNFVPVRPIMHCVNTIFFCTALYKI